MEKQTSAAFSQEFNFKEADEAPDDQFIMKGVYFNAFGAPEHHTNNQAKKKPKKRAFANRIRDQLDQISKLKEQEMNEQIKANNKSDCGNISSGNNNNSNSAQRNSLQNKYANNSESSEDDESKFRTTNINLQQSRLQNGGQSNIQMQNSQSVFIPQKQQHSVIQTLNSRPQVQANNNLFETQNISTNYNTNYQNMQSKNTFSNYNTPNIQNRNININLSNDSSSSDQEFQEQFKQKNKSRISPIPENPQQKVTAQIPASQLPLKSQQIGMQTQSNNNANKNTLKSSYQVGATCVQNKKNKKRNKSRVLGSSSNQSLSSNLQMNLQKKNKPFYSVNKSSSSSQQELDDDLEDEKETFTQQYINNVNNNQVYQNNPYQFQQKPNQFNQFRQQQQQRSQEQNDTSDLSPCMLPKNLNQQNINSIEYNQQLLDSSIQSVSIKKIIKNSSQSMSAESDIEEDDKNKNKFFERKMNSFFRNTQNQVLDDNQQPNTTQQSLVRNNNKLTNIQNKFTSNNNLQYHINAAASFGNNLQNYQANLSDRKQVAQSPSKQLFDSGIKRSSLPVNNVFNKTQDTGVNGSNYKNNSRDDFYQREKFIKNIDGEQSMITVKIENVNLKPFQTVIAQITSVERINPQLVSNTLKPQQMIQAILKQSYSLQHNTLQVGQQYIFKFHTLENSGSFPIINVNEYIPK
ncbi:hypothetical protein ABPG74_002046 [Tetrahymena malaccensis]